MKQEYGRSRYARFLHKGHYRINEALKDAIRAERVYQSSQRDRAEQLYRVLTPVGSDGNECQGNRDYAEERISIVGK